MADTTFVDGLITQANRIVAAWLNDVNVAVYRANSSISALVNRTLLSKLSDTLNAKDWGCKFDGVTDDTLALQAAVTAAVGKTLDLPSGDTVITGSITLPRSIKILGASRRGYGNPPATVGTGIQVKFAGPGFQYAPGGLTSADILLEGFVLRGDQGTYGAGNGITFTNAADVTLRSLVVSNFGTHNISTNGNTITLENVYSASAGTANFNIDSSKTKIRNCQSDGGAYGVLGTTNSADLSIDGGSWFEGATTAGISVGAQRTTIAQTTCNQTAGGKGILNAASAPRMHLSAGVKILGEGTAASTIGLDLGANIEFSIIGILSSGFQTAARVASGGGAGTISGCQLEGTVTGCDVTATGIPFPITSNFISGPTNSILHNSGSNVKYFGNRLDNGSGTYLAPVVSAGTPDADFEIPWTPGFAFGGAVTGITYTTQVASYTKLNQRIHLQGRVLLSSKGSSNGALTLTGLPFAASATTSSNSVVSCIFGSLTGVAGTVAGRLVAGGTTCTFEYLGTGTATSIDDSKCTNTTVLDFSIDYNAVGS